MLLPLLLLLQRQRDGGKNKRKGRYEAMENETRQGGGRERDARVVEVGRIAGSECKSTASDQSATRTTRNRKDSLFSFSWNFHPPRAPSRRLPHLFCLLAEDIFLLVTRFHAKRKGLSRRAAPRRAESRRKAPVFAILFQSPWNRLIDIATWRERNGK